MAASQQIPCRKCRARNMICFRTHSHNRMMAVAAPRLPYVLQWRAAWAAARRFPVALWACRTSAQRPLAHSRQVTPTASMWQCPG